MKTVCFAIIVIVSWFSFSTYGNQPNIVIFLTDDQGWGDLSSNGNDNLETPHIDSLAKEGATLENFYVCAVCAPTRAEFLTGRYHLRTGVSGVSRGEGRLNVDETTLADLFSEAGYATGAFGKWHNGTQSPYHPNDRGFHEFYGFTSGHWGHYFSPPLDHNGERVRGNGYVVDDFTDKAIAFIETNKDKPFFCYLPYNTPHSPMMVDDKFYDKFADFEPQKQNRDPEKEDLAMTRAALAMCENIDWNVGRVLAQLEKLNLAEDTIVFYFSDNGPNSFRWNDGMKGKKGNVDEGGLRSPGLIRWPGKIAATSTVSEVLGAIDLLPTFADLADIGSNTAHPLDGRSFAGLLTGKSQEWPDRLLFSSWTKRATVRSDRFRLDTNGQLFDILNDRGQREDVTERFPEEAQRLSDALESYRDTMKSYASNNEARPFTVGYAKSTTLPARDGEGHGTIVRSSKAPNNSFFKNWTDEKDYIQWNIETPSRGEFSATVYYTCAESDVGASVALTYSNEEVQSETRATVEKAFDPPLYDKLKERVEESHYFVKDFESLPLGTLTLEAGVGTLRLGKAKIQGEKAIDVHSIELIRE